MTHQKIIVGVNLGNYTFNAGAKTITINGISTLTLKCFLLIVNVTRNIVIYSPVINGRGATLAGNILTLQYDTTSQLNSDELQIHIALDQRFDPISQLTHTEPNKRDINNEQQSPLINDAPVVCTVDTVTDKILKTAHGILNDRVVYFTTTGTLPAPLTDTTPYYVVNKTNDDFKISLSEGGVAIDITSTGTGTLSYILAAEFIGTYTDISRIEHFEILYAATTPITYVKKIWSNDGVTQLPGILGTSTIAQTVVTGALNYNVVYDVNEGRNMGAYYKLKVVNGPTNQSATPFYYSLNWLIKTPYNGSFSTLSASLTSLSRALLVRSAIAGEKPDNTFENVKISSNNSLNAGLPADDLLFYSTPTNPALPSGSAITVNSILNTEPNVIDSGWISTDEYPGGNFLNVQSNTSVTIYLLNASDNSGNNMFGNVFPYAVTEPGLPTPVGAMFFNKYYRLIVVNTSGISATNLTIYNRGSQTAPTPVFGPIGGVVFDSIPAPLNKSVLTGKKPDNTYGNVAIDEDNGLQVSSAQIGDSNNSTAITSSTPVITRTVTDGILTKSSNIVTSATGNFTSADVGSRVSGSGIPSNTYIQNVISSTSIKLTKYILVNATSVSLTFSNVYTGTPFSTRSRNIQENLTTIVAVDASGNISNLGGCITFRYHPDVVGVPGNPTIVEVNTINSFNSVKNIGWLSNAGDYYSILFTPSRAIAAGETVYITTTHSKLAGNDFKNLPYQNIEEGNKTLTTTQSFIKAFDKDGNSVNIRSTVDEALRVSDDKAYVTPSGSNFIETLRDDITHSFDKNRVNTEITKLRNFSTGGTATADLVQGQIKFSTGATPGNTAIFFSEKNAIYEPGRGIVGEQTIELESLPTGNAFVEWGYKDTVLQNGTGFGVDATGIYVYRKKNNVYETKVYNNNWNRDTCNGLAPSLFKKNRVPIAITLLKDNLFRVQFEWLGADAHDYYIKAPGIKLLEVHVDEYPNSNNGSSLPTPELPLHIEVRNDTTTGGNLVVRSGSWRGGIFTSKTVLTGKNPDNNYVDIRAQGKDSGNSNDSQNGGVLLNAFQTWRGIWHPWQENYIKLITDLISDVPGTLYIEFSELANPVNGDDSGISGTLPGITYNPGIESLLRRHTPIQSKWYRHKYVNGNAGQSIFSIDAGLTISDPGVPMIPLSIQPTTDNLAGLSRIVQSYKTFNGSSYIEAPVNASNVPVVSVSDIGGSIELLSDATINTKVLSIGQTVTQIDSPALSNRKSIYFRNQNTIGTAFWSHSAGLTESNGIKLEPGEFISLNLSSLVPIYVLAANTGGVTTSVNIFPANSTGSTATNPNDALTSNDLFATIASNGIIEKTAGHTYSQTGGTTIQAVKLVLEAKKQNTTTETVVLEETQSNAGTTGIISAPTIQGGTNQFYRVTVSRDQNGGNVNSVTGGGLTYVPVQTNIVGGNRIVNTYYAVGSPASPFVVQASLNAAAACHISVSRFSNVNISSPVQDSGVTTGTGTAVTGPTLNKTNKGYIIMSISHTSSGTPGSGYTELYDNQNGNGSNKDGLSVEAKAVVVTGTESSLYTLASSATWAAIAMTINPAVGQNPVVKQSYELSAVPGATFQNVTLSSITDVVTKLDITSDQTWTQALINNIAVFTTGVNISSAAAHIDAQYLEITESSGNVVKIGVVQTGK